MTEEHEDIEEFDLEDDDSEEPEDAEEDRVAAVSREIARFERGNGLSLSDEEFHLLGVQLDLYGIAPEQSYFTHTDEGRAETSFEEDFNTTIAAVEREQGRRLLDREVKAIREAAERAEQDPTVETDAQVWAEAKKAAPNLLDTSDGIAKYIGERLAAPLERAEPSAVQVDEDGDEIPSFNADNRNERVAAIDARLAGEPAAVHDSSYEPEPIEGD